MRSMTLPEFARHNMLKPGAIALLAAWACVSAPNACAQAESASPAASDSTHAPGLSMCAQREQHREQWVVNLAIPIWIPGITGTLASGTSEIDLSHESSGGSSVSFFNSNTALKFAFMGSVDVRKHGWTGTVDGFYVNVNSSVDFKLNDSPARTADLSATMVRLVGGYEFRGWEVGGDRCLVPELYAGLRHYSAAFKATTASSSVDNSAQWADPIGGGRLKYLPSPRWGVNLAADVGGLGSNSDLSWSAFGSGAWYFAQRWSLEGGWNTLKIQHRVGSGSGRTVVDLMLQGPYLAIGFR